MSPDQAIQSFHNWIQTADETLRFPLLGDRSIDRLPDRIWWNANQYDDWRDFAELAMRIVTIGTSEADVERIISIHRDIASHKGTQYSHRTFRNRLQLRISRA
jgi:hypothetical protein